MQLSNSISFLVKKIEMLLRTSSHEMLFTIERKKVIQFVGTYLKKITKQQKVVYYKKGKPEYCLLQEFCLNALEFLD